MIAPKQTPSVSSRDFLPLFSKVNLEQRQMQKKT
jgi:hypothetical protein